MILRVTQYDEPILRGKGETVEVFDVDLKQLADDMVETMYASQGIGLAAQQVDQRKMICVIDIEEAARELEIDLRLDGRTLPIELIMPLVLINPSLCFPSEIESPYEEGCLSFPGIQALIYRSESIGVDYRDLDGGSHRLECDSLLARVIQHEIDHLNGVLFIDRMGPAILRNIEDDLKALKKNTGVQLRSASPCPGSETLGNDK